jgi:hypothetical protein
MFCTKRYGKYLHKYQISSSDRVCIVLSHSGEGEDSNSSSEYVSCRHVSGVRPGQIRKGATQAVVGRLTGGSGPKSVSGSSRMNLELGEYGRDTGILD